MRIAVYLRVSTTRQMQDQTIAQQLERLQAHIQAQGWALPETNILRDDGYSGANLKRPGLDRLRDRASAAEFDLVLITAPDRLARNYVHQVLLLEELQAAWSPSGVSGSPDESGSTRSTVATDSRRGR